MVLYRTVCYSHPVPSALLLEHIVTLTTFVQVESDVIATDAITTQLLSQSLLSPDKKLSPNDMYMYMYMYIIMCTTLLCILLHVQKCTEQVRARRLRTDKCKGGCHVK